jgi:hypothetical protein
MGMTTMLKLPQKKTTFSVKALVCIAMKDTLALFVKFVQKGTTSSVSQLGNVPNVPHQLYLQFNSWALSLAL